MDDPNASPVLVDLRQRGDVRKQASRQKDDDDQSKSLLQEWLPLGVGFHPSDADLADLLERKVFSDDDSTFDFYSYEPEHLHLAMGDENIHFHDDGKMYIFVARRGKFPFGSRINRDTLHGVWTLSGKKPKEIQNSTGKETSIKYLATFKANPSGYVNGSKRPREAARTSTPWHMQEFHFCGENKSKIVLVVVDKDKDKDKDKDEGLKKVKSVNSGTSSSPCMVTKMKMGETP